MILPSSAFLIACSAFLSPQIIPDNGIQFEGAEPWMSSGEYCHSNLSILPLNQLWLDNVRYYFNRTNLDLFWSNTLHVYNTNGSFNMDYIVSWLDKDWILLYTCNSTTDEAVGDVYGFNGANLTEKRPYIETVIGTLLGLDMDDFVDCSNLTTTTTEEPTTVTTEPTTVTTEEPTTNATETTVTEEPTTNATTTEETTTTLEPTTTTEEPTEPPSLWSWLRNHTSIFR